MKKEKLIDILEEFILRTVPPKLDKLYKEVNKSHIKIRK